MYQRVRQHYLLYFYNCTDCIDTRFINVLRLDWRHHNNVDEVANLYMFEIWL